jgi:hypothetical protein
MAQRLNNISNVAKISDLLSIHEGYEGWWFPPFPFLFHSLYFSGLTK